MKTLNSIISQVFRLTLLFLLAFIWVRYYERNLWLAVLYSAIISIILDAILSLILRNKQQKTSLKKEELNLARTFANHFIFNHKSVALNFFSGLLGKHFEIKKKTSFLWWEKGDDVIVFFPIFSTNTVKIRDLISIYNSINLPTKPTKIIVCAADFDRETINFSKSAPINFMLFDQFDTYEKLMKPNNVFPKNINHKNTPAKANWQVVAEYALNRKRTKSWLFSSLLLIFSSFFVRVSVYYLVISSLLLILAIISFTNTKYNSKPTENLF